MTLKINLLEQAHTDVEDIYFFIAKNNVSAADSFIDKLYEQLSLVADNPKMAPSRHFEKLGDVHKFLLGSPYENYLVFYRVHADAIEVPRVLHGARWKVITEFFGDKG